MRQAAILLIILLLLARAGLADSPLQKRVTLQFNAIDLYVVLGQVASDVGLAFIYDPQTPAPSVSVDVRDQPALSVVADLAAAHKVGYLVSGRALVVGPPRMIAQYRSTTTFVVPYTNMKPDEAAHIVQGVFPYVEVKVQGDRVHYRVPRAFVDRVKDIATSLDARKGP